MKKFEDESFSKAMSYEEFKEWIDSIHVGFIESICYSITDFFKNIKLRLKWFFQRLIYGCDETDTWSLEYTLVALMLPRLKYFKRIYDSGRGGIPNEILTELGFDKTLSREEKNRINDEAWQKFNDILQEIIEGFQDIYNEENDIEYWQENLEEECEYLNEKVQTVKDPWTFVCKYRKEQYNSDKELLIRDCDLSEYKRDRAFDLLAKYHAALWW